MITEWKTDIYIGIKAEKSAMVMLIVKMTPIICMRRMRMMWHL